MNTRKWMKYVPIVRHMVDNQSTLQSLDTEIAILKQEKLIIQKEAERDKLKADVKRMRESGTQADPETSQEEAEPTKKVRRKSL